MNAISFFKRNKITEYKPIQIIKDSSNNVNIGMSKEICVCCGEEMPEGFGMVCPACSKKYQ